MIPAGETEKAKKVSPPSEDQLRSDMLEAISLHPKAQFKSQQRDDPEWTTKQKEDMARQILDQSPGQFLARYGTLLPSPHLDYFRDKYDNYEVQFRLKELSQDGCRFVRTKQARNRRYAALRNMIQAQDDYFSEESMKARNPLLYQELIGQHMSEQEKAVQEKINRSNCALSTIILDHMDLNRERDLVKQQKRQETEEEFDDDSEDEDEAEEEKKEPIEDEDEKRRLKDEFVQAMHQSFLDGRDTDFDYSRIDTDQGLDDLDMLERDEEDRYFDED